MRHPQLPEREGHIVRDDWSPPDDPPSRAFRRFIGDWMDLWAECPRAACQRAKACRNRAIPCFEEQRAAIIEVVYESLLDGYLVDEDDL